MQISIHVFRDSLLKTDEWLNELVWSTAFTAPEQAVAGLRAVLQTLRDCLTHTEAAQLSAQLPLLVRGLFYEGWRPSPGNLPDPIRSKDEFLSLIETRLGRYDIDPERACHAVFQLLDRHITPGEIADVKHQMHHRVRDLWPEHKAKELL